MNTEPNALNLKKINSHDIILNEEFIGLINTLSDSIKEFYKVSKNVNKNKNMLLSLAEGQVNISDTVLNKISKDEINYEEINSLSNLIEKLRDIFNKLQLNIISEEKNLIFFFEDAKVLFKKMKEKRQELIMKIKKRSNSTTRNNHAFPFSTSHNDVDNNFRRIQAGDNKYNRSEINYNIKNINPNNEHYNKNNQMNLKNRTIVNDRERKSKTLNKGRDSINDEYYRNSENNLKSMSRNKQLSETKVIDAKSQNIEIEKLKMINKKLCLELEKCKSKTLETKTNTIENSNINQPNNVNIIIQDKDKMILGLKEDINKKNKKYKDLMESLNNYKKEFKKIKDENNKLKQNIDKNLKMKINNLIKEKIHY